MHVLQTFSLCYIEQEYVLLLMLHKMLLVIFWQLRHYQVCAYTYYKLNYTLAMDTSVIAPPIINQICDIHPYPQNMQQ